MHVTHFVRFLRAGLLVAVACSAAEYQASAQKAKQVEAGTRTFPHFERVIELETAAATSADVSIGDVKGDGNLDLVLAKGRHWPLEDRVLLGDGDLDVVISNDNPDPKLVYMNDGKGRFSVASTFGRPEWETRNARVADVNGDGQPDIIVANRTGRGTPANYVCLNRGQGRFDADCQAFSHESATTITTADFNRDGKIDVAVPHRDRGQSYVYMNRGQTLFPDSGRVAFGPPDATIRMTEAVDVDRDGFLDLVAIDENRGVGVYFGRKDGTFSPIVGIADGKMAPYALAANDLNGDGFIDIVVGHIEAASTIYFNDGSGRHYSPVAFGDAKGTVYGFAIADLDEDGYLDIAAARSGATNVVYFGGRRGSAGQVVFSPTSEELERRDLPVTKEDLLILQRAADLLETEAVWNRKDDRECEDDEASGKRSLFCALQKACIDVLGKYDHRRAALQEVRFAVEDATRGQELEHRLRDFNNLPQTTLADVHGILRVATGRIQSRLKIE